MSLWTILVAGGSGARFGSRKQFADIDGVSVIERSLRTAAATSNAVVLVVPADTVDEVRRSHQGNDAIVVVAGGASRSASVRAGLDAIGEAATHVLVHDAARVMATPALYAAVVAALVPGVDGVVPGIPVTDTIKILTPDNVVVNTPLRDRLVAVQTPQGFPIEVLRQAHRRGDDASDDAALVEAAGGHVVVVPGEVTNRKITTPEDLEWARRMFEQATEQTTEGTPP